MGPETRQPARPWGDPEPRQEWCLCDSLTSTGQDLRRGLATGIWTTDYTEDTKRALLSCCVCDNLSQSKRTKLGSKVLRVLWLRIRLAEAKAQQQAEHGNRVLWFFLQNPRRPGAERQAENWRLRPPDPVVPRARRPPRVPESCQQRGAEAEPAARPPAHLVLGATGPGPRQKRAREEGGADTGTRPERQLAACLRARARRGQGLREQGRTTWGRAESNLWGGAQSRSGGCVRTPGQLVRQQVRVLSPPLSS